MTLEIDKKYSDFYQRRNPVKVYPTEFVVRTFLAQYPALNLTLEKGMAVLDLGFGDGRNTAFLCEQGYQTYGIEITEEIVTLTKDRLENLDIKADLKVGRNSNIPYQDNFFDVVLACHSSYYCDPDDSFKDNTEEITRVLKKGGYFITSLPDINSYIFNNAEIRDDGHVIIKQDPYGNRSNYKMRAFKNTNEIEEELSGQFENFSFGSAQNNYYGIDERVFWAVCQKR